MQIKRAPDQTLIAFACHVELLRAVDIGRNEAGEDRSTFIRKALLAELKTRKQPVQDEWVSPPDRAKKTRYPAVPPSLSPAKSGKAASAGRKTSAPASRARRR
jgi:hypothetical protein